VQHTATHCSTLHCNALQRTATPFLSPEGLCKSPLLSLVYDMTHSNVRHKCNMTHSNVLSLVYDMTHSKICRTLAYDVTLQIVRHDSSKFAT